MADPAAQMERTAQLQAAMAGQLNECSDFIDLHGVDASTMSTEQRRLTEAMVLKLLQLMGTQSHNIVKEAFDSENDSEGHSERLTIFLRPLCDRVRPNAWNSMSLAKTPQRILRRPKRHSMSLRTLSIVLDLGSASCL